MQIPLRTRSSAEQYIVRREWVTARLEQCPLHPLGGCGFARHGTYRRVTPFGTRIARWYCPRGHKTAFSLLPDFLAARLPGLLDSIDAAVASTSGALIEFTVVLLRARAPNATSICRPLPIRGIPDDVRDRSRVARRPFCRRRQFHAVPQMDTAFQGIL